MEPILLSLGLFYDGWRHHPMVGANFTVLGANSIVVGPYSTMVGTSSFILENFK
ncbi:MAG: hypothetical protein WCL06_11540 [Bacteroidota bacterium]